MGSLNVQSQDWLEGGIKIYLGMSLADASLSSENIEYASKLPPWGACSEGDPDLNIVRKSLV